MSKPEKVTFEQRPAEPREDGYKPIKQRFGMIAGLPGRLARCPALRRKEQIKRDREGREVYGWEERSMREV